MSPFLVGFPVDKPLSRDQAQQVKDTCLAALKERLLERANIIQAHLDNEYQRLYQAQMQYKRSMGNGAVGKDKQLGAFFESTMFKIDILKTRLRLHEESALAKYVALDQKLNQHPKLQSLWADVAGASAGGAAAGAAAAAAAASATVAHHTRAR